MDTNIMIQQCNYLIILRCSFSATDTGITNPTTKKFGFAPKTKTFFFNNRDHIIWYKAQNDHVIAFFAKTLYYNHNIFTWYS